MHRLVTVALVHTSFSCFLTCPAHLITLPTHSRWLKLCRKIELHLTWLRSVGERRQRSHTSNSVDECNTCGSSRRVSSRTRALSRHGHPSRPRDVSAAVEAGSSGRNPAAQSRSKRSDQWQNGYDELHQCSTSASDSKISRVQAISNQ